MLVVVCVVRVRGPCVLISFGVVLLGVCVVCCLLLVGV